MTGLNARFDRQSAQGQPFYYANAILKGTLRASGRPLATVDL